MEQWADVLEADPISGSLIGCCTGFNNCFCNILKDLMWDAQTG